MNWEKLKFVTKKRDRGWHILLILSCIDLCVKGFRLTKDDWASSYALLKYYYLWLKLICTNKLNCTIITKPYNYVYFSYVYILYEQL